MFQRIVDLLIEDLTWGGALAALGIFIITFLVSIILVGWFLVKIPSRYFCRTPDGAGSVADAYGPDYRTPVRSRALLRWTLLIGKNLLGVVLLVAGIAMMVGPGQGILTILIAVMLLNFPGKRRLERWLVSRNKVLHSINWLRRRYGKPPLVLEASDAANPASNTKSEPEA